MLPIVYSDRFLEHLTGPYHPEKPERLTAIKTALEQASWADQLQWLLPTPITQRDPLEWINRVHTADYIQQVQSLAESGGSYLDPDTVVSSHSYEVALLAVNAWMDGVDQVLAQESPAFVLARPPGHHAVQETGMGFCLFLMLRSQPTTPSPALVLSESPFSIGMFTMAMAPKRLWSPMPRLPTALCINPLAIPVLERRVKLAYTVMF